MEYHGPRARRKHAKEIAELEAQERAAEGESEPSGEPSGRPFSQPSGRPTGPRQPRIAHERREREVDPTKDLISALALGFGVASCGFFDVPVLLYPIPLGLGLAGAALCLVVRFRPGGDAPWYAWLAASASIIGLTLGIAGYIDYNDVQTEVDDAQQQLEAVSE